MQTSINEALFIHYTVQEHDLKSCPTCKYSGFVSQREEGCNQNLICESCSMEWADADLIESYNSNNLKLSLVKSFHKRFIELMKVLFTEPCPKCGIYISKDGGCQSVVCGKCKHQFCWECLSAYPSYNHTELLGAKCPTRNLGIVGVPFILILLTFIKLMTVNYYFRMAAVYFSMAIAYFCCAGCYLASFFVHGEFYYSFERHYIHN